MTVDDAIEACHTYYRLLQSGWDIPGRVVLDYLTARDIVVVHCLAELNREREEITEE